LCRKVRAEELLEYKNRQQLARDYNVDFFDLSDILAAVDSVEQFSTYYHQQLTKLKSFLSTMDPNKKAHLSKLKQFNKNIDAIKFTRSEEARTASSIVIQVYLLGLTKA
jgi:hypothetical protein